MLSAIIHTAPIRQLGENPVFDAAEPRHSVAISMQPIRSSINAENDNTTIYFAAGTDLSAAMKLANTKRIDIYNAGALEFSGTITAVKFDGINVELEAVA